MLLATRAADGSMSVDDLARFPRAGMLFPDDRPILADDVLGRLCAALPLSPPVFSTPHFLSGLMGKMPFRIDLPNVVRELAVWHQDYFYVKGNTDIVTAWIPVQDTTFRESCLLVMPGSQKLGPIPHDGEVLGKRHYPRAIFDREVRYVETARGDLSLFNELLLHSSGVNVSSRGRFSVQARYSRLDAPMNSSMGAVMPIGDFG